VTCVAFAAGGRLGLSAGEDGTLRVWDLRAGREVRCLRGPPRGIDTLAASPDGLRAVTGGGRGDDVLRIWDLDTGKEVGKLEGHTDWVKGLALLPGGKRVVSGSFDGTVRVWDLDTRKEVGRVHLKGELHGLKDPRWADQVWSLALMPGGKEVLAGLRDGTVRRVELARMREVKRLKVHANFVNALAVSPDGSSLVTANSEQLMPSLGPVRSDGKFTTTDLKTGRPVLELYYWTSDFCVAFLPDGRRVVSGGSDGRVTLWRVHREHLFPDPGRHAKGVLAVAVSPDGRAVLSGGRDGVVGWWPLPTPGAQRAGVK
jgi:WD40 repeat protein